MPDSEVLIDLVQTTGAEGEEEEAAALSFVSTPRHPPAHTPSPPVA